MIYNLDSIRQAEAEIERIMKDGLAQCRKGHPELGVLGNGTLGKDFQRAYHTWMTLRAHKGEAFALSLGYG